MVGRTILKTPLGAVLHDKQKIKAFQTVQKMCLHLAHDGSPSIETCILSRVKQITSPGWMYETSAQGWYTGKTQRDWVEREVGGGIGMGNTCKSMADSCQCMAKTTTIL